MQIRHHRTMNVADLTPDRLRSFLEVVRSGGFGRAARRAFISPSAVSRQVAALERRLETKLFDRIGKQVHLTEAGRRLVPEARRILGDLERAAEFVRAASGPLRERLRVAASTTPGFYLLPRALGRFRRLHPEAEIAFAIENSLKVVDKVLENVVDVGFVGGACDDPLVEGERFRDDEIVCFAAADHPLAKKRRVDVDDLSAATLVLREAGSSTRDLFLAWFAKSGGVPGPEIRLGCPEAVKAVVAGGLGVGVLSTHALTDDLRRRRLKILRIAGLSLRRPLMVLQHVRKRRSRAVEAFLRLLRADSPDPPRRLGR
jgi:LysR family transcriptional regulator, transcriptional activator of the cysJI operon